MTAIAIVGMAGRFPGAPTLDVFWRNLRDGVESIRFFSEAESRAAGVEARAQNYVPAGGWLDDIELFDAAFFGFTPREAEITDPQHRLFLECAYEALEHAGCDSARSPGPIGVYAGCASSRYLWTHVLSRPGQRESLLFHQRLIASDPDFLSTRVSYKLDLKGPSMTLQTACSTSLVAVCVACRDLLSYQCDMALAGGVSINLEYRYGYHYNEGMVLSPDGHCRAFDARGQGTVGGDGVGVVVLKRLDDALADRDHIHAVIRGVGVNNDGSAKVGYAAPSVSGQAEAIAQAIAMAEVEPDTITYVEAHGTGTPLGDPIEIAALKQVFRAGGACALGAVKTNIGHLNTAAGIAGLIKTTLALEHRQLPPTLHFTAPNAQLGLADSPFYVNARLAEWPSGGTPRRAGVSSFGIGGTNAHVVLEEAPAMQRPERARPAQLIVLSAKTDSALQGMARRLSEHLSRHPELDLADVAYTLQVGRPAYPYRAAVVCDGHEGARAALATVVSERPLDRSVTFLFPGMGAEHVNMAGELYREEPTFAAHFDHCAELLSAHLGVDLRDVIYPPEGEMATGGRLLEELRIAMPALFAVEYALASLWVDWGIKPQALLGLSLGEYTAACLSGVFSLEDALWLVARRGQLMQETAVGAMLAVPLPAEEVQPLLGDQLFLAVRSGSAHSVVSGSPEAVEAAREALSRRGVECHTLSTTRALHSPFMAPILDRFRHALKQISLRPPRIPFLSNLTGTWITAEQASDPEYWIQHLLETVNLKDGVAALLADPRRVLIEVGPGRSLARLIKQHPRRTSETLTFSSLSHPQGQRSCYASILTALGRIWSAGGYVDWAAVSRHERRRRVPLPTYPFERQRYWLDAQPPAVQPVAAAAPAQPRMDRDADGWFYVPTWRATALSPAIDASRKVEQRYLLFSDEHGVGVTAAELLRREGRDVTMVRAGRKFRRESNSDYVIAPAQEQDYERLARALAAEQRTPHVILHLWNIESPDARPGLEALAEREVRAFYSLLFIARAWGSYGEPLQLLVATRGMQRVRDELVTHPEQALVTGPCLVVPQEHENILCRSLDLPRLPLDASVVERCARDLLAEVRAPSSEGFVAYRDGKRLVRSFDRVTLPPANPASSRLREHGVYLLTGGLGGIGLTLARHMAEVARARLVLTTRQEFPEPHEWDRWAQVAAAAQTRDVPPIAQRVRQLRELEALGAEVMVVTADVADHTQMQACLAHAERRFGPINGVIHTAGIGAGGAIVSKSVAEAAAVLRPKVQGTLVLEAVTRHLKLDFFVLCSSLNAILGGFGQVDYCAANAFQDVFAQHRRTPDGPLVVSINWDGWREVGMAARAATSRMVDERAR